MSDPQRYRKKPVEIEAVQMRVIDGWESVLALAEWCGGQAFRDTTSPEQMAKTYYWAIQIPTLEGTMRATNLDYVIRGVQGEFYPCKPDIFEATYEVVS